jgi:hypothetical protein
MCEVVKVVTEAGATALHEQGSIKLGDGALA